jgi:predicted DNA-binding transcriptional regulator YafY
MLDVSARLLHLLSLLQTRREWPGPELAERLMVSPRTLRRDIDRLRCLGYPVAATTGTAGGYRLGPGASLPPLLLDDDEAVAVTIGLRLAATGTVGGIEDASLGALMKLQQVLPSRLRHRVETLHTAIATTSAHHRQQPVSADTLVALADACRRTECVRFVYRDHHGTETTRLVEPHHLVSTGARWYLIAWDRDHVEWRSFRLDRLRLRQAPGPRFTPRVPPEGDFATYLSRQLGFTMWPLRAVVHVHAPAETIADKITGIVEPLDERTSKLTLAGDSLDAIAILLGLIDADFDIIEPNELRGHLSKIATRFQRSARQGPPSQASGLDLRS